MNDTSVAANQSLNKTLAIDPFPWDESPLRIANKGKQWAIPPTSSLSPLPISSPGYGCLRMPQQPIGYPIFVNSMPMIPSGFLAPYFDPNDNSTYPVICPATDECSTMRLIGAFCMPQGRYEPMPCPSGFFCPDYKTVRICPKGYYCLTGSSEPKKCLPLSYCPAGSVQQYHFGFLLAVIIFDLILFSSIITWKLMQLKNAGQPLTSIFPAFIQKLHTPSRKNSLAPNISHQIPLSTLDRKDRRNAKKVHNTDPLVKAFKRGLMGEKELTMNFSFECMSLTLPTGKNILNEVTGEIRAGRMTAIMGPSGAGKTTLMNVLMGKVKRSGGDLLINGVPCEMEGLKKIIGFVPQEDIMLRELTVRENILHSARCRLPSDWTSEEVNEYVDNIIKVLNLTHVANSQIGDELTRGVSGGQRKRVNIGMELAAVPMSLFLDEPTSGLDATSALDVTNILKCISRLGITIISIIHQPRIEIFEKFDDILLVAPGGRTTYIGPVENAQPYFERLGFYFDPAANSADILMDIIAGRGVQRRSFKGPQYSVDDLVVLWSYRHSNFPSPQSDESDFLSLSKSASELSSKSDQISIDIDASTICHKEINKMFAIAGQRGAPMLKQIWFNHERSLIQQYRTLGSLRLEIIVGLLAGGVMGFAALPNEMYTGVLIRPFSALSPSAKHWFVSLYGLLIGMSIALSAAPAAVQVFGDERAVYFREASSGHSKIAYFIGKTISSLYRVFISSAHFTALLFFLARIPIDLFTLYILVSLNFLVIYGVGQTISMIVSHKNAPLIALFFGLFMGVFCGSGPSLTEAENSKIGILILNLSGNRWFAEAFFGMWVNAYQGVFDFDSSAHVYGYQSNQTIYNIFMMLILTFIYRIAAFVLMVSLQRDKQR